MKNHQVDTGEGGPEGCHTVEVDQAKVRRTLRSATAAQHRVARSFESLRSKAA